MNKKPSEIHTHSITTRRGNTIQFFYNPDNNLIVVDLISNDESGGFELFRKVIDENKLLAHTQ